MALHRRRRFSSASGGEAPVPVRETGSVRRSRGHRPVSASGGAPAAAASGLAAIGLGSPAAAPEVSASTPVSAELLWQRPARELCIIDRSTSIANTEAELHRAILIMVVGTRPTVSVQEAQEAVAEEFALSPVTLKIARYAPEDFILLLPDNATAYLVLRVGGGIRTPQFSLHLKRWSHQAHARCMQLLYRADISMGGIPTHAWELSTAEQLLAPYCWVEAVHPDTSGGWTWLVSTSRHGPQFWSAFPGARTCSSWSRSTKTLRQPSWPWSTTLTSTSPGLRSLGHRRTRHRAPQDLLMERRIRWRKMAVKAIANRGPDVGAPGAGAASGDEDAAAHRLAEGAASPQTVSQEWASAQSAVADPTPSAQTSTDAGEPSVCGSGAFTDQVFAVTGGLSAAPPVVHVEPAQATTVVSATDAGPRLVEVSSSCELPQPTVYPLKTSSVVHRRRRLKQQGSPLKEFLVRVSRPTVGVMPIAKNARLSAATATKRAQANLMRKLGILGEQEHISVEAQDDYARLFSESLSQAHVEALEVLFGWSVPVVFVDPDHQELCLAD
ncbi:hypothetical protein C2845_PM18G11150 [Panicum miliaceum]|uniref:DUF4283 domain-containing protein n=1 Tax=Panicum miliaceum TaxID=4540 RepID=A0A3L6PIV9_PANMI|nr:hypothetical protein C2845_PM18G11150 [Panicum miliaceum]